MLDLFGKGYVIDHCIQAAKNEHKEILFRSYISDLLKAMAESNGVVVNYRYAEIILPKAKDNRTGDEVALDVIKRAGLKVKENDTI